MRNCRVKRDCLLKGECLRNNVIYQATVKRVNKYNIEESNTFREESFKTGVPLTIVFHLLLKHLSLVIKKNLHILYLDIQVRKVYTQEPFVAFRTGRNLSSYLVRAKGKGQRM